VCPIALTGAAHEAAVVVPLGPRTRFFASRSTARRFPTMPLRLNAPVLSLDAGKMHEIDPSNPCSLMAMWSIFSKCSETLKDGPRLENMSWRVWSRESLCVGSARPVDMPTVVASSEVPSLSNSISSEDSLSEHESCPGVAAKPRSMTHDDHPFSRSRGLERHLTPLTLEKIVVSIQEKTELGPLSRSLEASLPAMHSFPPPPPLDASHQEEEEDARGKHLQNSTDSCLSAMTTDTVDTIASTTRQSDHRDSDTSVSSDGLIRSGSVVHGFSPITTASLRWRTSQGPSQPVPTSSKLVPPGKTAIKPGMFTLGGSSEDDDSSFEQRIIPTKPTVQRSSLSQSLTKQNSSTTTKGLQQKKTSFRDIVEQRRIQEDVENDEGAIESSDDEDEDVVEDSAIEDEDDDAEWEDSNSDDGKPVQEPHLFRRVDSRPELVSRRSLLTLALHKGHHASTTLNQGFRSSPALRRSRPSSPKMPPTFAASPDEAEEDGGLMMQAPKSRTIPVPLPVPNQAVAHSPRTTRRNMLSTELTESLRKNLLWERQQKSQTANAFLKRSRNAQSMANLPSQAAVPPPPTVVSKETSKNNSWNHYFDNPWEYHTKGW